MKTEIITCDFCKCIIEDEEKVFGRISLTTILQFTEMEWDLCRKCSNKIIKLLKKKKQEDEE